MRKCLAEFFGTFVLVFGGVGSAVLAGSHIGYAGVAFAFGLALLAMVYTIGPVSGCHINPAVTLSVLLAKRIGTRDISYVRRRANLLAPPGRDSASALILYHRERCCGWLRSASGRLPWCEQLRFALAGTVLDGRRVPSQKRFSRCSWSLHRSWCDGREGTGVDLRMPSTSINS